jgi:hypothetical protein
MKDDTRLGRMVRNIPARAQLERWSDGWTVARGDIRLLFRGNTLEAALDAAGVTP